MMEVRNIPDFNDFMEQLLARTECSDLEYKSAAGGFPGSFWDTYSAFANTDGGTIVLGVCEKEHKFYLDSLKPELVEKYQKDFWNNVNNKSTISCNLMKSEDVLVEQYKGHTVMLFLCHAPIENNDQFIARHNPITAPSNVITKETTSVLKKKYNACLPMPIPHVLQTVVFSVITLWMTWIIIVSINIAGFLP